MTVLCIGGTGNVGRALVPLLLERGESVRVVTRDQLRMKSLPSGVDFFVGDLNEPGIIAEALDGVRSVYMALQMSPTEAYHALSSVNVMTYNKPDRLVYLSSDISIHAPFMPAAGVKVGVEAAIKASGIPFAILRPTYFHQNDYLVKDAIMNGVFPLPLGPNPVARIDVRDIADVAAAALVDGKGVNQTILLSSLDAPNDEETAAIWSEALGRDVAPPAKAAEVWGSIKQHMPPSLVFDLDALTRHFEAHGHPLNEADLEIQDSILLHPTRGYRQFVAETAEKWLAERS